jgi:sugar phosphate permease
VNPPSDLSNTRGATGAARGFLGWRVLAAAFVAQLLASGLTFASFGVFVIPLSAEFDTPRGRLNLAFSLGFIVMGGMGPIVGHWMDRGHARIVMVSGIVIAGLGLFGLSQAESLWQLGVFFCGFIALGTAMFGMTPATTLVANWFIRRRGLALGVAAAGATMASLVSPPLAAWLIEHVGWRGAFLWFGVGAFAIGLPVFFLWAIARPEQVGQRPDGDHANVPAHAPRTEESADGQVDTKRLVRDARLWLISVGFSLVFTSPIIIMLSVVPFGEDLGFSKLNAAWFFTASAPFSILGKITFGAMADRIPPKLAAWIVVLGNMLVWMLLYTNPSYPMFLAIGAIYGLAIGATAPLNGVMLGLCFGRIAIGRASGLGGLASLPLISGTPAVAGYLYDSTGNYHAVFVMQVALLLIGGVLLSFVRFERPPRG